MTSPNQHHDRACLVFTHEFMYTVEVTHVFVQLGCHASLAMIKWR